MAISRVFRYAAMVFIPASLHAVEIQGAETILKRLAENSTDTSQPVTLLRSASALLKTDPNLQYYSRRQAPESPRATFLSQPLINAAAEILEMTIQRN